MAAKIHIHTKYSLLDAIIEPEELVKKCVAQGDKALCVTEHGNVYSNVELYKLCKQYGIKYLYGCEMYICDDVNVKDKNNKYHHLVVIAKNETGRLNLNKLVSESCKYKYYGKPRIDFEMLKTYKDGLIVCSACMLGEIQKNILEKKYNDVISIINKYKNLFGDDYYLEYQSHSEPTQQALNKAIVALGKKLNIKYIVTTDAHYLNKNDQKYHSIFVQIGQAREVGETYNDCYVQSDKEILAICKSTSKEDNLIALKNTEEIANKCNVDIPLSAPIMPHVDYPKKYKSEIEYLKALCVKGWTIKKINLKPNKDEYKKRLLYEMNAIEKMGFEGYFLLVHSYCNSVKRRGIARGSAGGSLVCYLSNITDIDPLEYGLYFERFIDVGALDLLEEGKITKKELKIPDVDSDFGKQAREDVLNYVIKQYGKDRVVSLGSFQYIWAKGAIKDIGRVLGIPFDVTNTMTAQLNDETIQDVIDLGLLDKYKNQYPELFDYAQRLAGLPKSFSAHPCGKVISMDDITYYNAVDINEDGLVILQGDMHTADDLGLIKADFLGLRTVDVIYDTLELIGKDYEYIAPHNLNFDDEKIWENFRNGFTSNIFQFESSGMKDTLKKINCNSIEDLSVANALFRPGSIKFIDNYANRKKGIENFEYLHPDLEHILNNTYGIIVFQEQLIEIGRLAKLSNPDELRKATAKKKAALLDKIKPELYKGLQNRNWSIEQLDKLWESMLDFAKYSFNKCVSGSTILIKPAITKCHRNPSIEEMYKIMHDLQFAKDNNYLSLRSKYLQNKNYGTALSMFEDGKVRKNKIIDIQESGIRKVYRIKTLTGKWIDCTDNHNFPTPNGKKKLSDLNVGDELYILGEYKKKKYVYNFTDGIETLLDKIVSIEYIREEMTYDVTMDEPAHNFVVNNGLITCNSHSSAYALIAYICMFLKTYHPKEFMCACINSVSDKVEKVAECIKEVNRLGVSIYMGKYNDCSGVAKPYKDGIIIGTNSIKYCNENIANELMSIKNKKSFVEVLDEIQDLTINKRQLNALIVLNFFSDFGENQYLLNVIDLYSGIKDDKSKKVLLPSLRTCSQIKKDKLELYSNYGVTEFLVKKYSEKETPKQYGGIDNIGLLVELTKQIPNKPLSIQEQCKMEKECLQYVTYTNSNMKDYYYIVVEFKTYKDVTKPYITLKNIETGEEIDTRIKQSKIYKQNPFGLFSILKIDYFTLDYKTKYINGEYRKSDEREKILEEYEVVKQ